MLEKRRKVILSDWSRRLTAAQRDYATTDALASLLCCMALKVFWAQQQSAQLQQLHEEDAGLDVSRPPVPQLLVRQQQVQQLLTRPQHMPMWILSKGGSKRFRKATGDTQAAWRAFVQRGCGATARSLGSIRANVAAKAEAGDPLDWQTGSFPCGERAAFGDWS